MEQLTVQLSWMEARRPDLCPHSSPERSSVLFSGAGCGVSQTTLSLTCTQGFTVMRVSNIHFHLLRWGIWDRNWVELEEEEATSFLKCHSAFFLPLGVDPMSAHSTISSHRPLCLHILQCLPNFYPLEMGLPSPKCEFCFSRSVRALCSVSEVPTGRGHPSWVSWANYSWQERAWNIYSFKPMETDPRLSPEWPSPQCVFLGEIETGRVTTLCEWQGLGASPRSVRLHGGWGGTRFFWPQDPVLPGVLYIENVTPSTTTTSRRGSLAKPRNDKQPQVWTVDNLRPCMPHVLCDLVAESTWDTCFQKCSLNQWHTLEIVGGPHYLQNYTCACLPTFIQTPSSSWV